jgi:mono/diheme cytochrome c family protein
VKYIIAAVICLGAATVHADDSVIAAGKELHDKHCLACHKTELYTSPDRKISSREKLSARVHFCEQQLGLQWFDEEVESVAEYLNKEFYHFK